MLHACGRTIPVLFATSQLITSTAAQHHRVVLICLQEIGGQVLHSCCTTSAAKLSSAAAAVGKLRANELAEGVADLAVSPAEAPDALQSLLAALQRVRVLVTAGADELSRDKQVAKACQVGANGCGGSCCAQAGVLC
jgi:hypothetical protein